MTARKSGTTKYSGEKIGLKLLQSVREMKTRNFPRSMEIAVNEVVELSQSTVMSTLKRPTAGTQ